MERPFFRSRARAATLAASALALPLMGACSADRGNDPERSLASAEVDTSSSVVQRGPRVEVAFAESSLPLRDVARAARPGDVGDEEEHDHPVGKLRPRPMRALPFDRDPVLQSAVPFASMPAVGVNFLSQGNTNDPKTEGGTPPDTNGAVGPHHFVQLVNTGLAVWDKAGHVVVASENMNALWTGYVGTNPGNSCATQNDGDPVVVYDQLADRWFLTQFSLPNGSATDYQCVAVSKTGDPTGAYWLYDFPYAGLNDYGKFGVWPDAYYATFNLFGNTTNGDSDLCAYDRVSMLRGAPATQQCFPQQGGTVSGALPVSMDGVVPPPRGEPGFFLQLSQSQSNSNSLDLFKLHVDWAKPANTTLTGPTNIAVVPFTQMCAQQGGTCVPQPAPGNQVDALSDRLMFRLTYRNFGTHEALMVNHSVDVTGATGGVRWYEIWSPNGTPVIHQQGTYAPNDGNWRWMASLAQDQAEEMVLGFSISSTKKFPSIGWTGRLAGDPLGVMGQGESVIDNGTGVETGAFSDGTPATRWGDYSNITLDPLDDCTFWYTQELYHVTGPTPRTWDTQVASVKFPSCAANDFSLGVAPALRTVAPGAKVTYTVTTPKTKGTAETIALAVQDLPSGVSGAFTPATAPAGTSVTLTLTAAATAPDTSSPVTFTVIGKAPSAVHAARADVSVGIDIVDAGTDSGPGVDAGSDASGGTGDASVEKDSGSDANAESDSGGASDSGPVDDSSAASDSSVAEDSGQQDSGSVGVPDASVGSDASAANDSGAPGDSGASGSPDGDVDGSTGGGSGSPGGCGCETVGARGAPGWQLVGVVGLGLIGARRRRRRG